MTKNEPSGREGYQPTSSGAQPIPPRDASGFSPVGEYLRLHRRPLRERLALAGPDAVEWFDRTNEHIVLLTNEMLAMSRAADRTRDLLLEFQRKHL